MTSIPSNYKLKRVSFTDLPHWERDDISDLFPIFQTIHAQLKSGKAYKTGSLGLTASELLAFIETMNESDFKDSERARQFFESNTVPFRIDLSNSGSGFVTGFYEPEILVSRQKNDIFKYPIYRVPTDLVPLTDSNRPDYMNPSYAFGRKINNVIDYYPDRKDIDLGCLEDQGLAIAYAKSKIDLFFVHIQGAARMIFPSGEVERITYAAKAGHPFSAIGKHLIEIGELDISTVSMQTIRQWLEMNPDKQDDVLWLNRSYIFFKEATVDNDDHGPIAAAKVPLRAGKSLAVDRNIHTFGFPFYLSVPDIKHLDNGEELARTLLALDTGTAIVGAARGDIFTGSGAEAGEMAGIIKNDADFFILIPKSCAERYS